MRKRTIFLFLLVVSLFRSAAQPIGSKQPDMVMHLPPIPEFSAINLCFGDTAQFINQSTGGIYYFWTIMDTSGNVLDTSSSANLSFYFSSPGTYIVDLQADNGHISSITKTIIIGNIPIAGFSFQNCANNFNTISSCSAGFFWDFGDGTTSTAQLPVHQYSDTGSYTVTLIVTNGLAYDTLVQSIYVSVVGTPDPSFTLNLSSDTLFFQINNYIPYELINWNFGDGGSDAVIQSYYVYQTSGTYYVSLMVRNQCGIYIHDTVIIVSVPVNVSEPIGSGRIKITAYPNPAENSLTIESMANNIRRVVLYDQFGQVIGSLTDFQASKKIEFDVSTLIPGYYYLKIITDQHSVIKKIIKNKAR